MFNETAPPAGAVGCQSAGPGAGGDGVPGGAGVGGARGRAAAPARLVSRRPRAPLQRPRRATLRGAGADPQGPRHPRR